MTRPGVLAIAVYTAVFAAIAGCQGQTNAVDSGLAPLRIVGLQYPRLALLAVVQGRVELEASISTDGSVTEVKTIFGNGLLVEAATNSLHQWRYKPCASSGAACRAKVRFVFVLENGSCDVDQCRSEIQIDLPNTVTIRSKPAKAIIN